MSRKNQEVDEKADLDRTRALFEKSLQRLDEADKEKETMKAQLKDFAKLLEVQKIDKEAHDK